MEHYDVVLRKGDGLSVSSHKVVKFVAVIVDLAYIGWETTMTMFIERHCWTFTMMETKMEVDII